MGSFKFIHAADLHLNSRMKPLQARVSVSNVDFEPKLLTEAPERAFKKLIDYAKQEQVDFVVISGDLFDADTRGFDSENYVIEQFRRLIGSGEDGEIPVYLIYGNHDAASKMQDRLVLPSNCKVFSTDDAETKDGPEGLKVKLHGQGFKNASCPTALVEDYPEAVPDHFNIGLLHTSLNGYRDHDPYAPCEEEDLKEKEYDYWALGHIHKRDEVSPGSPVILFPGNIQGRKVSESGVKGATLVEVTDHKVKLTHKPLDVGRWVRVEVDVTGLETVSEVIDKAASAVVESFDWDDKGDELEWVAVRVVVMGATGAHSELLKDSFAVNVRNSVIEKVQRSDGSFRVWIEDVKTRTTTMISLDDARKRKDAYGEVIRQTDSLSGEMLEVLGQAFERVKAKAVAQGFSTKGLEAVDPGRTENSERMRASAQQELLTRIRDEKG